MPAKDALNLSLFHGSSHVFEPGEVVSPDKDIWGEGEVHATNDPMFASTFGDYVYEVSPLDAPKMVQEEGGKEHWVSRKGYRVTKQVY